MICWEVWSRHRETQPARKRFQFISSEISLGYWDDQIYGVKIPLFDTYFPNMSAFFRSMEKDLKHFRKNKQQLPCPRFLTNTTMMIMTWLFFFFSLAFPYQNENRSMSQRIVYAY